MGSFLGFLGGAADAINGDGSQGALTRLNNSLSDPEVQAQRLALKQNDALQQFYASQAEKEQDPALQRLAAVAAISPTVGGPQYSSAVIEKQKTMASNPLAAAFTTNPGGNPWDKPQATPTEGEAPAAPTTPQPDPYALKPESADDKRNYEFLNSHVPPQYRQTIRAISNGDESVGNADSLRSNGLLQLAEQFDPSMSKTDYALRLATVKDSGPGGKSGQAVTSANTAVKHLAQVALASLDLHNGNNQVLNWLGNEASALGGDDKVTNLRSTVDTVAPELAKAAASGGDTTDADRKGQRASFGIAMSPEQALGAVAGKADLINSKMDEVANSYKTTMGRERKTLTDDNKQTLTDLRDLHNFAKQDKLSDPKAQAIVTRLRGVIGSEVSPATATKATAPITATNPKTGQKLTLINGQWQ